MPQPPQLFGSVEGLAQKPPQTMFPSPHSNAPQTPSVHVPLPQTLPQAPQLFGGR